VPVRLLAHGLSHLRLTRHDQGGSPRTVEPDANCCITGCRLPSSHRVPRSCTWGTYPNETVYQDGRWRCFQRPAPRNVHEDEIVCCISSVRLGSSTSVERWNVLERTKQHPREPRGSRGLQVSGGGTNDGLATNLPSERGTGSESPRNPIGLPQTPILCPTQDARRPAAASAQLRS
jgi:hypothetical protein